MVIVTPTKNLNELSGQRKDLLKNSVYIVHQI